MGQYRPGTLVERLVAPNGQSSHQRWGNIIKKHIRVQLYSLNSRLVDFFPVGQWHVAPDSPLADLGMRATLKVIRCEHHEDDYYEYNHDELKDFTPDPTFYQFPLITPFKTPPSGPQSYLKESPTPEYLDDGILNDEDSTKALQPVGSTEIQSGKVKGEPAKELNRQRRDTTGQIGPANKQLENGSHANNSADGNVDFYDDYSGDFEYIDLYGELDPRSHVGQIHTYFIAAEEIEWDYGGGQSPYFIKDR